MASRLTAAASTLAGATFGLTAYRSHPANPHAGFDPQENTVSSFFSRVESATPPKHAGVAPAKLAALVHDIQTRTKSDEKPLVDVNFSNLTAQDSEQLFQLWNAKNYAQVEEILRKNVAADLEPAANHLEINVDNVVNFTGVDKQRFGPPAQAYFEALKLDRKGLDPATCRKLEKFSVKEHIARVARDAANTQKALTFTMLRGTPARPLLFDDAFERSIMPTAGKKFWKLPYYQFAWPENRNLSTLLHPSSSLINIGKVNVPGARFRECYYWDTYWVIRGLVAAGSPEACEHLLQAFYTQVDQFGFIPNGTRTYYLDRSQPPVLAAAAKCVYDGYLAKGNVAAAMAVKKAAVPRLLRDYFGFWMGNSNHLLRVDTLAGRASFVSGRPTAGGALVMKEIDNPNVLYLNRYHSECTEPRPESYSTDVHLEQQAESLAKEENATNYYSHQQTRGAAESGWDFSSRWRRDAIEGRLNPDKMTRAHYVLNQDILNLAPVDLNSLLLKCEDLLAEWVPEFSSEFQKLAAKRRRAMRKLMTNRAGMLVDYDVRRACPSAVVSAASFAPIALGLVGSEFNMPENLLQTWGVNCEASSHGSTEQWDGTNGWPPLVQWGVEALERRGRRPAAAKLAAYYCASNQYFWDQLPAENRLQNRDSAGGFPEKISTVTPGVKGEGGEYECQLGFGWTCGVIMEFVNKYGGDDAFVKAYEEALKEIEKIKNPASAAAAEDKEL